MKSAQPVQAGAADATTGALPGGWWLTGLLSLLLIAGVSGIVLGTGSGEESLRLAIRTTARTTLVFFLATFVASSLRRLWRSPLSRWLLANRRYLGVTAAVSHALHVGLLGALGAQYPDPFLVETPAFVFVAGGGASLFLFAMALTSSDAAVRRLGVRWKWLHRIGAWYVWGVFAFDYVLAVTRGPLYGLFALLVLAALGVRVLARRRSVSRAVRPGRQEASA